jgi:hypothetical protein
MKKGLRILTEVSPKLKKRQILATTIVGPGLVLAIMFAVLQVNLSPPENDFRSDAIVLEDLSDWCSENASFSNEMASPDQVKGACWDSDVNSNVWFKFQAPAPNITVQMKTGASEGSLRYGYLSLWDSEGFEITCASHVDSTSDLTISHNALRTGQWYYISVDNRSDFDSGIGGTFSLCVNAGLDYDWKEGAIELSDLDNWTSPKEAFSTLWATPDEKAGSCSNLGPQFNRWFTFLAPQTDIRIKMLTGEDEGTLQYGFLSLWDDRGNEIACKQYTQADSDLEISSQELVAGTQYFISVDNLFQPSADNRGSFTLHVDASLTLPPVLIDLAGDFTEDGVMLHWSTSEKDNIEGFLIERSVNGSEFDTLGMVARVETIREEANFVFSDPTPQPGYNFYRIRQIGLGDESHLSEVLRVFVPLTYEIHAFKVFPTYFGDHLNIFVNSGSRGDALLTLRDLHGRDIAQKAIEVQAGEQTIVWNFAESFSPGVYYLNLAREGSPLQHAKVIHQ